MRFAHDLILWLLLAALPGLLVFLAWAGRRKRTLMTRFVQTRLLPQMTARVSPAQERLRTFLLVGTVVFLFLALARPQWGYAWQEARHRGLDIVVAIDTSRSMLAKDVQPNRLERARLAALDLIRLARSDRLGLVAFAGSAYLQCPLTLDEGAFRQTVQALDTAIIPQGGTALGGAIDCALAAFKDENNHKILVLMTDGEDHDPASKDAAQRAAKAGMRIFTLGVGTPGGEVLRITDEHGAPAYIKDEQGNVVKSRLDEALLQDIATLTGGFYLPLRSANAMEQLYQQGLAPIPKTESAARWSREYHERYAWPLGAALVLLLCETLLPYPRPGRLAPASLPLAALLFFATHSPAIASSRSALRDYEAGRFKEAAAEYDRLCREAPDDPRLHYNAGTSAYRAGDLAAAASAFTNVIRSQDLSLQQRGFYNLGNTLYRMGEQSPELERKRQAWENALLSFQAARSMNTNDVDAANNHDFVQKKLEELKQQQQQQKKQQDQPDKGDSQDQQNSGKDDPQQQQSPPQDSKPKPGDTQQPQDAQKQPGQRPESRPDPKQDPAPAQPEQPADKPSGSGASPQPQPEGDSTQDTSAGSAGRMTPEQASQLLDSQRGDERAMLFIPLQTNIHSGRVFKDW